jgi:hypothetical protein
MNGLNRSFITCMKVAGALQILKGMSSHSNRPSFVLKAVFQISPLKFVFDDNYFLSLT